MSSQYVKLPLTGGGGGGGGAVDSFNGRTGVVVSQAGDYSAAIVSNTPAGSISATNVQSAINELDGDLTTLSSTVSGKQDAVGGTNNSVVWKNTVGAVEGSTTYSLDSNFESLQANITVEPDNDVTFYQLENLSVTVDPLQNSPDDAYGIRRTFINSDPNSTGFSVGTSGVAYTLNDLNVNHFGTGDLGTINLTQNNFTIGNGTDPIDFKGVGYQMGFGTVAANVTVSGPLQGYGFQPAVNASATMGPSSYINAFYDFANIATEVRAYQSASFGPTIASIANNNGYTGININPTISNFTGNSGVNAIAVSGTYSNFGTGGFTGINVNPTATGVAFATGVNINMSGVTGSNIRALDVTGDVNINGNLSFTGGLSIGKLNAYDAENIVDGGGTPTTIHGLISAPTLPANATIANADMIGVNTAALMTFNANATATTNLIGIAALALPAVVQTHTGSLVDLVTGATFAISLDGASTGGTITQVSTCRSTAIPNGITTVDRLIGYEFTLPFGDPGTDTWGVHVTDASKNYFEGAVVVGTSENPTNSSVGVELNSTTKAVLLSRMDTTARNALTAVDGMVIYNTTTSKIQAYAGGTWVDLH